MSASVEEEATSGALPTLKVNAPGVRVEAGFAADANGVVVVENNDVDGAEVAENNASVVKTNTITISTAVVYQYTVYIRNSTLSRLSSKLPLEVEDVNSGAEVAVEVEGIGVEVCVMPKLNNPPEAVEGAAEA